MTLGDCLQSMQGYGVALQHHGDGLVIQSVTFKPTDQHKAILKAFKPLLLAIIPDGVGLSIGTLMDAVEAYQERTAIMEESEELPTTVERVALAQARRVLNPA
jgi:hypothetical protein